MSKAGLDMASVWLCDGHGWWLHEDHGLLPASEARSLGAPVPEGEQDPDVQLELDMAADDPADDVGGEECPF